MTQEHLVLLPVWYVVFVLSITCHEAAHAAAALYGGDRTAYLGGQVSLKVSCDAPGRRVIRVEVRQPDGSNAPWLTRNVVVAEPVTITAAVATSDPTGEWSVKVTNVLTGASTSSRFTIE